MSEMSFNYDKFRELKNAYGSYAEKQQGDAVIKAVSFSLDSKARSFEVSTGDYKGKLFRSDEMKNDNNRIRDAFKKAVTDIFGEDKMIPKSVREAMKLDTDFDKAGRPLKAHRIQTTIAELEKYASIAHLLEDHINDECRILRAPTLSDEMVAAAAKYAEMCSTEVAIAAENHLLPDVQKKGKISKSALMAFYREVADRIKEIKLNNKSRSTDYAQFCAGLQGAYLLKGLTRHLGIAYHLMTNGNGDMLASVTSQLQAQLKSEFDETVSVRNEELDNLKDTIAKIDNLLSLNLSMERIRTSIRAHYLLTVPKEQVTKEVDRIIARGQTNKELNLNDLFGFFYKAEKPEFVKLRDVIMSHVAQRLLDGSMPPNPPVTKHGTDAVRTAISRDFIKYVKDCRRDLQLNALLGRDVYPVPDLFKDETVYARLEASTKEYLEPLKSSLSDVDFKPQPFILGEDEIPAELKAYPDVVKTLLSQPDFNPSTSPLGFDADDPEVKFVDRMADMAKIASNVIANSGAPEFKTNGQLKTTLFATVVKCYIKKNPGMVAKLKSMFPKGSTDTDAKMKEISDRVCQEQKDLLVKLHAAHEQIKAKYNIQKDDTENIEFEMSYVDKDRLPLSDEQVRGKTEEELKNYQRISDSAVWNSTRKRIKDVNSMLSILDINGPLRGYMADIAKEIANLD